MRVLLVGTSLHQQNRGGALTYFGGLVRGLATVAQNMGLQLAVVAPKSAENELMTASAGGVVEFMASKERRGAGRLWADWTSLDRSAREWSADIVHYPHEWAPPLSVPTVLTIQNVGWMHPLSRGEFGSGGRLLRGITRRTASHEHIRGIIAVSAQAADLWCGLTEHDRSGVAVIPEPVHLPIPPPDPPINDRFFIGVAGDARYKNRELLLSGYAEARRRDPNLPRLLVVGSRPGREAWEGVEELGWVRRDAVLGLITQSMGVAFPSAVESFGLPYYESLSRGRPCLVLTGTPMADTCLPGTVVVETSIRGVADGFGRLAGTSVPAGLASQVRDELAPTVVARSYVDVYRTSAAQP